MSEQITEAPTNQRYRVEKASPYGYSIIDTTGQDKPYTISLARNSQDEIAELDDRFALDPAFEYGDYEYELETNFKRVTTDLTVEEDTKFVHHHDPAYMSKEAIDRMEEHDKEVAEHWCEKWNLVEAGHCGACRKKFAEGEKRYPAVGFHSLDRTICFHCACSQED
jgi:hypothetical protein